MNLYLLRHGIAAEPTAHTLARDSERLLTPKGARKIRQVAKAMDALELTFGLILSSPYLRARQTAEIVARALDLRKQLQLTETLVPGAKAKELIDLLKSCSQMPENVLLVGHEPYLSELIALLISGDTNAAVTLRKGSLCKLAVENLKPGPCASLEWLLTPKQMELMA